MICADIFPVSAPLVWVFVFNLVMGLLTVAGLVALVVWIVRGFGRRQTADAPLEIARTRYARGEITQAEFEEIKKNLNS